MNWEEISLINFALTHYFNYRTTQVANSQELSLIARLAANRGFSLDENGIVVLPEGVQKVAKGDRRLG